MRGVLGLALAGALCAGAASAGEPTGRHNFRALDVFALEFVDAPEVSPDGRTVAYVRRSNDIMTDSTASAIWLVDTADGAQRPLVAGGASYASPQWSPRGDRLAYIATEKGQKPELRVMLLRDRSVIPVARLPDAARSPTWSPDGKWIAFIMWAGDEARSFAKPPPKPEGAEWAAPVKVYDQLQVHEDGRGLLKPGSNHLFVVPAEGGTPRDLTPGKIDFETPRWLDNGTILVAGNENPDAELDPIEKDIFAVNAVTGARRAVTKRDGPDGDPVSSPDGKLIAFVGYDDRKTSWQKTDLYVMAPDGSGIRNLTAKYERGVGAPEWRPDGKAVLVTVQDSGETLIVQVDLDGRTTVLTRDVGSGSNGRPYGGGSFSVGGTGAAPMIAYTQVAWEHPADLALMTPGAKPRRVTDLNADVLGPVDLATIEPIKVKSSFDGRMIDAWIAKPPGFRPDGSYPMILEIHGGPMQMYGPVFAAEHHRYAAEGYVVVWSNPRGSVGYGEDFTLLIDRNFPGQDYDDLMSVVDAVVAKNYVDRSRLFVTGGSAGGTLTAWTVAKTQRFAAGAAVNPVINWMTVMLAADTAANVARHLIRAYPWEERDLFWKGSPISQVGSVKTPTMLMVGEEDWRTPPFEAEQFYTALKLRGVDTALVRVPGAGHGISNKPSQLVAKTDNVMGWFRAHDPKAGGK